MSGKTLIVWETVPEKTDMYLVPNEVADKHRELLRKAHGKFVNTEEGVGNQGLDFLNAALSPKKEYVEEKDKANACIWHPYKRPEDDGPIENETVTHVYVCGFVL